MESTGHLKSEELKAHIRYFHGEFLLMQGLIDSGSDNHYEIIGHLTNMYLSTAAALTVFKQNCDGYELSRFDEISNLFYEQLSRFSPSSQKQLKKFFASDKFAEMNERISEVYDSANIEKRSTFCELMSLFYEELCQLSPNAFKRLEAYFASEPYSVVQARVSAIQEASDDGEESKQAWFFNTQILPVLPRAIQVMQDVIQGEEEVHREYYELRCNRVSFKDQIYSQRVIRHQSLKGQNPSELSFDSLTQRQLRLLLPTLYEDILAYEAKIDFSSLKGIVQDLSSSQQLDGSVVGQLWMNVNDVISVYLVDNAVTEAEKLLGDKSLLLKGSDGSLFSDLKDQESCVRVLKQYQQNQPYVATRLCANPRYTMRAIILREKVEIDSMVARLHLDDSLPVTNDLEVNEVLDESLYEAISDATYLQDSARSILSSGSFLLEASELVIRALGQGMGVPAHAAMTKNAEVLFSLARVCEIFSSEATEHSVLGRIVSMISVGSSVLYLASQLELASLLSSLAMLMPGGVITLAATSCLLAAIGAYSYQAYHQTLLNASQAPLKDSQSTGFTDGVSEQSERYDPMDSECASYPSLTPVPPRFELPPMDTRESMLRLTY